MNVENIIATARRATAAEIESGVTWYNQANEIAAEIAPNLEAGAGVIAALSPRMPWDRNVSLARQAFINGVASGSLGSNVRKANSIIEGQNPENVLGGDKVRSFYANIVNPFGDDVTIDRHAFDIAMGYSTNDKARSVLSRKGVYEQLANMYREAGSILGLTGAQVQAITWVVWRREKGIK